MTSPRRPRTLVVATASLALAGVLAGCSATNPIQTEREYDASDGVGVTVGDVRAANLMVVATAEGEQGLLRGALTNDGDDDVTVTVTFGDATGTDAADLPSSTVDVPAGATVLLDGTDGDRSADVTVDAVAAPPGAVTYLTLATDAAGAESLQVPVIDPEVFPEYSPAPSA